MTVLMRPRLEFNSAFSLSTGPREKSAGLYSGSDVGPGPPAGCGVSHGGLGPAVAGQLKNWAPPRSLKPLVAGGGDLAADQRTIQSLPAAGNGVPARGRRPADDNKKT
jgi:hypothetical protein